MWMFNNFVKPNSKKYLIITNKNLIFYYFKILFTFASKSKTKEFKGFHPLKNPWMCGKFMYI
jgi:hypothetical protein